MALTLFNLGDFGKTTRAHDVFGRGNIVRRKCCFSTELAGNSHLQRKNPLYFGLLEKLTNAVLENMQTITVANASLSCFRTKYAVNSEIFFLSQSIFELVVSIYENQL